MTQRRTPTRRSVVLSMAAAAAVPLAGPLSAQTRPKVAAVNYPLAYFAQTLVGDMADVIFPVPPGSDPSFWRPGIADISAMQGADVIALNGTGFANWTTKVSLPRSKTVDTSKGFADRYIKTETVTHSHGEDGAHSHTGTATYTWLDFTLATLQAEALATAITRKMPDAKASIALNLETLKADLASLDTSARDINAMAAGRTAIASHPRYQYFGQAYGLDIAAMAWDANEDVTDAQWQALAGKRAETGASLFVWEAEPTQQARARMKSMGLVDVVFPPLANRPASGDFLSEMSGSIEAIKRALSA